MHLNLEALDERIVPATVSGFDARLLLARGAAERAITGSAFSPSIAAFNNFNRFVNTFDRLQIAAQQRLNRVTNFFNTRINTLNAQLVNQVVAAANGRLGDFFGPGQVIDGAFVNQFNSLNTGLTLVPGQGFVPTVTTTNPIGQFGGPGRVLGTTAFINRFNAQLNRLNTQVTTQLTNLNRVVNSQLNGLNTQMTLAGAPFSTAFSNLSNVFSTQLANTRLAFTQGLASNSSLFTNAFNNVNTLVTNPALVTSGFNQFATNLGNTFGLFNQQFNTGLNDFTNSFNVSLGNFNQGFNSGLGDFYNALNSQFNTPSPGFGIPSTGFQFAPNPGLILPGLTTTTTTTTGTFV